MERHTTGKSKETCRGAGRYTTRIIKAGALLGDTKILLSHWDTSVSVRENMHRFREQNLFGKASRSRVENILAIFRQRYLTDEQVTRALVVLVQRQLPTVALDRILYFHAAQSNRLLYDVVTEILLPRQCQGPHRYRCVRYPAGITALGG